MENKIEESKKQIQEIISELETLILYSIQRNEIDTANTLSRIILKYKKP